MARYNKDKGLILTNDIRNTWKEFIIISGIDLDNLERLYDGSYRGDVYQMIDYKTEEFPTDLVRLKQACAMFEGKHILTQYIKRISGLDRRLKHHKLDFELVSKLKRVVELMYSYN